MRRFNATERSLEPRVESLEKLLRGNGAPGIAATLERIDERLKGIEDNRDFGIERGKRLDQVEQDIAAMQAAQRVWTAGIAAIVAVIVTVLLSLTGIG